MVYELYYKKMYAICLRYASNADEAKDLLHDGFIKTFKNIKQFREYNRFESWLYRLFTNHCLDYVRSAYKKYIVYQNEYDDENLPESQTDEDFEPLFQAHSSKILTALGKLRPDYRIILNLYAIENYSHQQIADQLGIQVATSRSKLMRARKSLIKIMAKM